MTMPATTHRSAELPPGPRLRARRHAHRHRIGPPRPPAALLDARLRQQLQAAGIATESLVAVRAATGEWLLLRTHDQTDKAQATQTSIRDDLAFANAVRAALDDFHLTHRLQANPLLECEAIKARGPSAAARLNALRDWLRGTTENLSANPATARAARILHRTYFEPARSQQLAAEALGMGYSTYRRLLAEARALLIAELRLA